jgi:prolipoprotein diacylglyceryl transferase
MPPHWWGPFAIWDGGLGLWGGVLAATLVGIWRVRRHGGSATAFMDAAAPGIIIAQAIGRIGNYFNQEFFGGPQYRPTGYAGYSTFHPTFLHELLFDLAWAGVLIWLGHRRRIAAPGIFALYVVGYSVFRIFEESLRVDYSEHFLGLRLNSFVATAATIAALGWFVWIQRRRTAAPDLSVRRVPALARSVEGAPGADSEPVEGHGGGAESGDAGLNLVEADEGSQEQPPR